jgi:hypothetical protein
VGGVIVILTVAAAIGAVGGWAVRRDQVASEAHADELVRRLSEHPARGLPIGAGAVLLIEGESMAGLTPPPGQVIEGEVLDESEPASWACEGQLNRHVDGHMTCHNGRHDCLPGQTRYRHSRPPIGCNHGYGCGICLTVGGAS